MRKAGIIGYGRFGKILTDLLSKKYEVKVYDIEKVANDEGIEICSMDEVLECFLVWTLFGILRGASYAVTREGAFPDFGKTSEKLCFDIKFP